MTRNFPPRRQNGFLRISPTSKAVRDLDLRDAEDQVIFFSARNAEATVMTKDSDFLAKKTRSAAENYLGYLRKYLEG